MVDPIGPKPVPTSAAIVGVTRVAAAATPAPAASQGQIAAAPGALARELAAKPPIDHERVAAIRRAIAEGSFPITPAKIADRLIGAQFEWTRHDPE